MTICTSRSSVSGTSIAQVDYSRIAIVQHRFGYATEIRAIGRVDGVLPKLQVDVCVLGLPSGSRRCHKISTILKLSAAPLRTVLSRY